VTKEQKNELLDSADDLYYAGKYAQAIELYEQLLSLDPNNQRALEQLTKAKFNLVAENAPKSLPLKAMQSYRRARSYISAGATENAIGALREAIETAHQAKIPFHEAEELLSRLYLAFKELKKPKVFISYSRSDFSFATDIYWFLRSNECNPWMDIYDLVPGQDWELEINHNIKSADFFVACLSKNSVSKRGFVQKELKEAIATLEKMPEGEIYIIPIRLDDCIVPNSLASKQWLNWSATNAKASLLRAIKPRK